MTALLFGVSYDPPLSGQPFAEQAGDASDLLHLIAFQCDYAPDLTDRVVDALTPPAGAAVGYRAEYRLSDAPSASESVLTRRGVVLSVEIAAQPSL